MNNDFCRTIREMLSWSSRIVPLVEQSIDSKDQDTGKPGFFMPSIIPGLAPLNPYAKEKPSDRLFLIDAEDERNADPYKEAKLEINRLLPSLLSHGYITTADLTTPKYIRNVPVVTKVMAALFPGITHETSDYNGRHDYFIIDSIVRVAIRDFIHVPKDSGVIPTADTKKKPPTDEIERLDASNKTVEELEAQKYNRNLKNIAASPEKEALRNRRNDMVNAVINSYTEDGSIQPGSLNQTQLKAIRDGLMTKAQRFEFAPGSTKDNIIAAFVEKMRAFDWPKAASRIR